MADTLDSLQVAAQQGQTADSIKESTGVRPTNALSANTLGASPNSAQMMGTPANKSAAIKDALGSGDTTLAGLQRLAPGRVQAKEGQSTDATKSLEDIKSLTGLAGKVGQATQEAIAQSQKLPLQVEANLTGLDDNTKALYKSYADAVNSGDTNAITAAMSALSHQGITADAIAKTFNVQPEALWAKIESTLPPNVTVDQVAKLADPKVLTSLRNIAPPDMVDKLGTMSWSDAKAMIDKASQDSISNVSELQKQATDMTLPAATRNLAITRLKELGVTGEYQASKAIAQATQTIDDLDNVYVGGQPIEVSDLLKSPEAKAAVVNVLNGTADIKSLQGTPFEGLIKTIQDNFDVLAREFGLDPSGTATAQGRIQQYQKTRDTNATALNSVLTSYGIIPTTSPNVLKALGVTDEMLNGYATFDQTKLNSPALDILKGADANTQKLMMDTLESSGVTSLITDPANAGFADNLKTDGGRRLLNNLGKMTQYADNYGNTPAEQAIPDMLTDMGIDTKLYTDLASLGDVDLRRFNGKLPPVLDSNNDGKLDDADTVARNIKNQSSSLANAAAIRQQLASVDFSKISEAKQFQDNSTAQVGAVKSSAAKTIEPIQASLSQVAKDYANGSRVDWHGTEADTQLKTIQGTLTSQLSTVDALPNMTELDKENAKHAIREQFAQPIKQAEATVALKNQAALIYNQLVWNSFSHDSAVNLVSYLLRGGDVHTYFPQSLSWLLPTVQGLQSDSLKIKQGGV